MSFKCLWQANKQSLTPCRPSLRLRKVLSQQLFSNFDAGMLFGFFGLRSLKRIEFFERTWKILDSPFWMCCIVFLPLVSTTWATTLTWSKILSPNKDSGLGLSTLRTIVLFLSRSTSTATILGRGGRAIFKPLPMRETASQHPPYEKKKHCVKDNESQAKCEIQAKG